jgi:hypothetical protein
MRLFRRLPRALSVAALLSLTASVALPSHAQDIVYSNINVANFTGLAAGPGGAQLQGANTITRLLLDELSFDPMFGGASVGLVTFAFSNSNNVPIVASPRIRFYAADGPDRSPGTFLSGYTFDNQVFPANTVDFFTFDAFLIAPFTLPLDDRIWAGITFDDTEGTSGATAAQLDNLGLGVFDPPSVGSSFDHFFLTAEAGSFFGVNNPAGEFFDFEGTPVANFGWQIQTSAAAPEPGALSLGIVTGLPLLTAHLRRRHRSRRS